MKNKLFVFIDGLQYEKGISKLSFLNEENSNRITPGIGFSNNIYPEMLCGKNPDEMGYFNEWSPHFKKNKKLSFVFRFLDMFRGNLYINAGIRKIILKKFFKIDYANIPFKYCHYFKPQGSHQFRDLPGDSLLNEYGFKIYDAFETGLKRRIRDFSIIDKLSNDLKDGDNYFLSLLDLDHSCHVFGSNSVEVDNHLAMIDSKLTILFDDFMKLDAENEIYLFSDHGMVDVHKDVFFDIESHIGNMHEDEYFYFVDSTYVRIWVFNNEKEDKILNYLNSRDYGGIVSSSEREKFGLTNKDFGDLIFRANEGIMLAPNFYGGRSVKAMHGYDSSLPSQKAIFSKINNNNNSLTLPSNSKGIYSYLKQILN
jgi:hypothetical protein